jgi:cell division septation protein DedD
MSRFAAGGSARRSGSRTPWPVVLLLALATAALATSSAAQTASLDRVDSLIAAGDYQAARAGLERWWATQESAALTGADRARALMLRAQLASDPAAAEADYLSIVLGYPLSPDAPRALLRLGQGLLAVGEPARAAGYLQRLVADYPGRPERATGLLWLARAQRAARQGAAACAAAREGLRDGTTPELAAMFQAEERLACASPAPIGDVRTAVTPAAIPPEPARTQPEPARTPEPVRTPDRPAPPPATRTADPAPASGEAARSGRFAVQTGAYRQQQSVDDAVARLRRGGYDPRVIVLPGSTLIRVRVGRFATSQEAGAVMAQLRRAGFDAIVVADAEREQRP